VQLLGIKTEFPSQEKRCLVRALGLAWLCLFRIPSAGAQTGAASHDPKPKPAWRLLTAEEGRSVVSAAWALEQPSPGAQDCSHLIHDVYKSAGFEYRYDSSFDLYLGNEDFVRVKLPHTGDLIVWPGHVGIVVDPRLHSFYSLVSTGLQEQNYEGPYWKARGLPHFFRYKVQRVSALSATKVVPQPPQLRNSGNQVETSNANEDPAPSDAKENPAVNRVPQATSSGVDAVYRSSIPPESTDSTTFQIPSSINVAAGDKPPTREEVAEAISELNDAAGNVFRSDDPLKAQFPVVIIEQFRVKRVDVKRDRGWARLEIDSKLSIRGGKSQLKARHEEVRWELRRTESGWEAIAPPDRTYVPHDVAVKNLAAQLARLTANDHLGARQEKVLQQESGLANLLSALLSK